MRSDILGWRKLEYLLWKMEVLMRFVGEVEILLRE